MYTRQPDRSGTRVRIPENYSGHAFRDSKPLSDMPPPTRLDTPPQERNAEDFSNYAHLPFEPAEEAPPVSEAASEADKRGSEALPTPIPIRSEETRPPSLFSSLLPSSLIGENHFPFGHGLGSEEILILAIMLLVYASGVEKGETDTEFLIMLGLLLFAG